MENKKKSKLQIDLDTGFSYRWVSAANINKNFSGGIELLPVHPYLDDLTNAQRRDRNTVYNRLVRDESGLGMGLDYELNCNTSKRKIRILVRWLDDPDLFIKDTASRNLAENYDNAFVLLLNKPVDGITTHYQIISIAYYRKMGYTWRNSDRKGNSNRLGFYSPSGKSLVPNTFDPIPISGNNLSMFGGKPSIWAALKKLCI